ncbi:MAG: pyridoxal-dependent decarboxylase [Azospirillaceae bacterium]|nr:pyridoxal-dependent decarboxylase [Azospirillaceae bacterium]
MTNPPRGGPVEPEPPLTSPSLDPVDWDAYRVEAHRLLDAVLDEIRDVAAGPAWRPLPDDIKAGFAAPLPQDGEPIAAVWAQCRDTVMPYGVGNRHPRFLGWVHGAGTVGGMLGELAAAGLNANLGGRDHAPVYLERQVVAWFRDLFGFPETAAGLLVTGTSTANLIGVTVARTAAAGPRVRQHGVAGLRLVGYASDQVHGCVAKAFDITGLGRDALRLIPTDRNFRIEIPALQAAIAADRRAGFQPFLVVGCAGTVNTGAIDPLPQLADLAAAEGLWFHVDGAFGGLVRLAPALAPLVAGIERADSLAFDFHKWLHVPYDAGGILVRDGALQVATFGGRAPYLAGADGGTAGGEPWFCDLGIDLSRGFRALKVWFTLKEHGARRLGAKIADNCRLAAYLAARVIAAPDLELAAPVPLNIVCLRYVAPDDARDGDALNAAIVVELQRRGLAVPSTTVLERRLAIRVNITNHRTQAADLDLLVRAIQAIGRELTGRAEGAPIGE